MRPGTSSSSTGWVAFGEHHELAAVGVDTSSAKHVLGLALGSSTTGWPRTRRCGGRSADLALLGFERDHHPTGTASLREGLDEMFTLQRLELPSALTRCRETANIIESPQGGESGHGANG